MWLIYKIYYSLVSKNHIYQQQFKKRKIAPEANQQTII